MIPISPFLSIHELPDNEHNAASELGQGLSEVERHAKSFASAVSLFDLTRSRAECWLPGHLAGDWPFIAARGAVIAIYNFDEAIRWVQANLRHCPTIFNAIDSKNIRATRKIFIQAHPNLKRMRDMVVHTSEMRLGAESVKHQGGPITHDEVLIDDNFVVTVDGKDMNLALTLESVQLVAKTCGGIFNPFLAFDIRRRLDRRPT